MSYNPYQETPSQPTGGGGNKSSAKDKVQVPAILLIVAGIISALSGVVGGLSMPALFWGMKDEIRKEMENDPEMTPELFEMVINVYGFGGIAIAILSLIAGIVMVAGGMKMMKLQSRGLAMFAAVIALIPCFQGCCLLTLPAGIFAIITLNDENVKRSFK